MGTQFLAMEAALSPAGPANDDKSLRYGLFIDILI
jgi:hypothetical protein